MSQEANKLPTCPDISSPDVQEHQKLELSVNLTILLEGLLCSRACFILNTYLGNFAKPVSPAIPVSHHNGAVLSFSPIKTSGSKSMVKLLTCVVVAESPLCLKVTAFY